MPLKKSPFSVFSALFSGKSEDDSPSGPAGERAYIIGDIHGCHEQMMNMLGRIEADNASRGPAKTWIVFLGDLIDRGPKSREVIDHLANYSPDFAETVFLMGNHEEVFLKVMAGAADMIEPWFTFGGDACARSYGVEDLGNVYVDPSLIRDQLVEKVPHDHISFITTFVDKWQFGDFLCVHAGIRPRQPIEKQTAKDMRWIRDPFLRYGKKHDFVIVHGHTVVDEAQHHGNRIALDTGVYDSGVLSCLMIEGKEHDFLSTPAPARQEDDDPDQGDEALSA